MPEGLMDTGSRIVAAFEAAWCSIQVKHPDVPEVVMITGPMRRGKGDDYLGYHAADRWQIAAEAKAQAELFIAGELLAKDGREILHTLLHEAAHALAHARGIKDCSRQGRYHNRRFAALATELGLTPPEAPHRVHGLAFTCLPEATATAHAHVVAELERAAIAFRTDPLALLDPGDDGGKDQSDDAGGGAGQDKSKRDGRRFKVTCGCGRSFQVTPKVYEDGPILCGLCKEPFTSDDDTADIGT